MPMVAWMHLSASETRVAGPTGNDERENHLADPRTKEGGEGDRQKDSRKREKRVNEEQIHDAVERATVVAGEHCSTWPGAAPSPSICSTGSPGTM